MTLTDRYLDFWNADADHQRDLAGDLFSNDVRYVAPVMETAGVDALIDFRREFVAHVPTVVLRAREAPEEHHDHHRLRWELVVDGLESFATGTDVLAVDDGRITSIVTFLDRAPEGFEHHD